MEDLTKFGTRIVFEKWVPGTQVVEVACEPLTARTSRPASDRARRVDARTPALPPAGVRPGEPSDSPRRGSCPGRRRAP